MNLSYGIGRNLKAATLANIKGLTYTVWVDYLQIMLAKNAI